MFCKCVNVQYLFRIQKIYRKFTEVVPLNRIYYLEFKWVNSDCILYGVDLDQSSKKQIPIDAKNDFLLIFH